MARKVRASNPQKVERRKPAPVETRHLAHPRIWETAIRLADGNMTRIKVETFGKVTVTLP